MIIMRDISPGPGWKLLQVAFIRCETTGRVIVPQPHQKFWTRA
jgi:hypothetical protein